jgi:hypothetical protein
MGTSTEVSPARLEIAYALPGHMRSTAEELAHHKESGSPSAPSDAEIPLKTILIGWLKVEIDRNS